MKLLKILLFFLFILNSTFTYSQTIQMIGDINKTTQDFNPTRFCSFNNKVYFSGYLPETGNELWVFDSLNAPQIVLDIKNGSNSSSINNFIVFNNKLYFSADNGISGNEVWVYDGVSVPKLLFDLNTGAPSSNPTGMVVFNNKLIIGTYNGFYEYDGLNLKTISTSLTEASYFTVFNNKLHFSASTSTLGNELYQYDGVNSPTIVYDLVAGYYGGTPRYLTVYKNKLIFSASITFVGNELYIYDGVSAPKLVLDIKPGSGSGSTPDNFYIYKDIFYFTADNGVNGKELWKYDGVNIPKMLVDIYVGSNSSSPGSFTTFKNKLYFNATNSEYGSELWGFDNNDQPYIVDDIYKGNRSSSPRSFLNIYNKLYFSASDALSGNEIRYIKDSTGFKAKILNDVNLNTGSSRSYLNKEMITYKNKKYFMADNSINGSELFVYDGVNTPELVYDINKGVNSSAPTSFIVFNNLLYFSATDSLNNIKIWVYDGVNIPKLAFNTNLRSNSTQIPDLISFNNKMYFIADDGVYGLELWEFDGVNQPKLVYDLNPGTGTGVFDIIVFNNKIMFVGQNTNSNGELWAYDGINNPFLVKDIYLYGSSQISDMTVFNNKLYFAADEYYNGKQLWVTESNLSTYMVRNFSKPNLNSTPNGFTIYKNKMYFSTTGYGNWTIDENNVLTKITIDTLQNGYSFYVFEDKLYFSANVTNGYGSELYEYDNVNSPKLLTDINKGSKNSSTFPLGFLGKNFYFLADDGVHGSEIWELSYCTKSQNVDSVQTCEVSYKWRDSVTYFSNNNQRKYRLIDKNGCDSIISLNLNFVKIDTSLTTSVNYLKSNQKNAFYTWINIDTKTIIPNENSEIFYPIQSGNYASIITLNNCTDTSSIRYIDLTLTSLNYNFNSSKFIYPNPSNDKIYIQSENEYLNCKIYDLSGRLIVEDSNKTINISELQNGVYVVRLQFDNSVEIVKFLKN